MVKRKLETLGFIIMEVFFVALTWKGFWIISCGSSTLLLRQIMITWKSYLKNKVINNNSRYFYAMSWGLVKIPYLSTSFWGFFSERWGYWNFWRSTAWVRRLKGVTDIKSKNVGLDSWEIGHNLHRDGLLWGQWWCSDLLLHTSWIVFFRADGLW